MPEIKSPIGTRTFTATSGKSNSPPLRTFEVADDSDGSQEYGQGHSQEWAQERGDVQQTAPSQSEIEARIRAARQAKASGHNPINSQAKERVEYLAGIGRLSKDVQIDGTTFSIRTLKGKENRESILAASQVSRIEALFEGRRQHLARAIYKIDGADIDYVLGTKDLQAKLEFIEELDENISNYLYEQYAALNDEAIKKFGLKNEADVKQVVEDVKK